VIHSCEPGRLTQRSTPRSASSPRRGDDVIPRDGHAMLARASHSAERSRPVVTSRPYSHLSPNHLRGAVAVLDDVLPRSEVSRAPPKSQRKCLSRSVRCLRSSCSSRAAPGVWSIPAAGQQDCERFCGHLGSELHYVSRCLPKSGRRPAMYPRANSLTLKAFQ
jgi:hypothetical protein